MFIYFLILVGLPIIAWSVLSNFPKMIVKSRAQADELIELYKSKYSIAVFCFAITLLASVFMIIDSLLPEIEYTFKQMVEMERVGQNYGGSRIMGLTYDIGEGGMNLPTAYVMGVISFIAIIICVKLSLEVKEIVEDKLRKYNEHIENLQQKENELQNIYNCQLQSLISQYGEYDNIIDLKPFCLENSIIAFSDSQKLYVQGTMIDYQSILACNIVDNYSTVTNTSGKMQSISQTNTSNAIGRAIVGGAIAGSAGAIIGGTTAQRETSTTHNAVSTTRQKHDFIIILEIKDIANPIIKIYCAEDEDASYEILAMIKAIISLKN